jgi:hypothetical protein
LHVHTGQQERIDIGERTTRAMPGVVAEGLGDTIDHGVDPASAGHAADVDLQARLAARMEAVGAGHRAQQAVAFLAFGHRHALAADVGAKPSRVAGTYWLAPHRNGRARIALHPQRAGAAAAIGSAGAGSSVARRASMKRGRRPLPASRRVRACASSKSPRSAGAVWPRGSAAPITRSTPVSRL